jgi:hypothetical protein
MSASVIAAMREFDFGAGAGDAAGDAAAVVSTTVARDTSVRCAIFGRGCGGTDG